MCWGAKGGVHVESETEGRGRVMLQAESWREGFCWECERRLVLEGSRRPQVDRAFAKFISYYNIIK